MPKKPRAASRASAPIVRSAGVDGILGRAAAATLPSGRVPAKWRWHRGALLALRRRLLEERGELRHNVAEPLEPHSLHEADSASDEFDHELAFSKLSADSEALREVDDALRRLESGAYGVCEESGRPIPSSRLRAIPWTRFTREAQEKLEKVSKRKP